MRWNLAYRLLLACIVVTQAAPCEAQAKQDAPASAGGAAEKQNVLWQKLGRDITRVSDELDGVMSLKLVDLTSGRELAIRPDEIMPQASSIKVAVLAELYHQAGAGKLQLTDEYVVRREDVVPGSTVLQGLTPGVTRLTLRDLACIMVAVSDNSATNVLIDRVGMENVNAYMESLGLKQTRLRRKMMDLKAAGEGRENVSTAGEMAQLLGMIYRRKLFSQAATSDFFQVLESGRDDGDPKGSTIVRGLPDEVEAATKPGELEAVRNDSGIVFVKGRPYVLCVMTTYDRDEKLAEEAITRISSLAYQYFDRVARASEYGRVVSPK